MKFRYDATEDLRKSMGSTVVDVTILRAIKQWTEHPTNQLVVSDELVPLQDAALDRAILSQSSIGWTNLFRGFVSNAWGFIYYEDDDECPLQAESSPKALNHLALVVRALQDYSLAIWKSRNVVLHENSVQSLEIVHADLNQAISRLYDLKASYSPILQSYFTIPLPDRLLRPLCHKQRWLRLATLASSHSTSKGSRQQLVSTYFPYVPTGTDLPVQRTTVATSTGSTPANGPSVLYQVPITTLLPPRAVPP